MSAIAHILCGMLSRTCPAVSRGAMGRLILEHAHCPRQYLIVFKDTWRRFRRSSCPPCRYRSRQIAHIIPSSPGLQIPPKIVKPNAYTADKTFNTEGRLRDGRKRGRAGRRAGERAGEREGCKLREHAADDKMARSVRREAERPDKLRTTTMK